MWSVVETHENKVVGVAVRDTKEEAVTLALEMAEENGISDKWAKEMLAGDGSAYDDGDYRVSVVVVSQ